MINVNKRAKHANQDTTELNFLGVLRLGFIFTCIFCAISAVLLLIVALIFYNTNDPSQYANVLGKATLFTSSLLCSFLLSKKIGRRYIPLGFTLGIMISLLIFLVSVFLNNDGASSTHLWLFLTPVVTVLGSVLGIKREKKQRHNFRALF